MSFSFRVLQGNIGFQYPVLFSTGGGTALSKQRVMNLNRLELRLGLGLVLGLGLRLGLGLGVRVRGGEGSDRARDMSLEG